MSSTTTIPSDIPLHRLLKPQEVDSLLAEFAALLPRGDLALVSASGRFFAGSAEWDQKELQTLLAQVTDRAIKETIDGLVQPLVVNNRLVGALVARKASQVAEQTAAKVLRCLHSSLALMLDQAIARRDIVRETLDRYREINLLYRIGETISACLDPNQIPQLILKEVRAAVEADVGLVLLSPSPITTNQSEIETQASFGADRYLEALRMTGRQLIDQVVATGNPRIATPAPPIQPVGETASIAAMLCAPLKAQEKVLGSLVLGRSAGQPEFTAGDVKLIMALTGQAAIAIETARLHEEEVKQQRLEEELTIARQIQLSLLPKSCPEIPGWEFAALYRSARQVGGDLYDFIPSPDDSHLLSMVIADVTGKGVPAALFMAFSRTVLRVESLNGRNPATALRRTNRFIVHDLRSRLFLSAFYATLDTRSGQLVYANGGHDWPLWLRADSGEIRPLAARGFVLGAFEDIKPEEREIKVAPGDLLVFFTDGVTEARNSSGGLFGEDRLHEIIAANANASAQQLLHTIVNAVEDFSGTTPQTDDLTLFVVKRQR